MISTLLLVTVIDCYTSSSIYQIVKYTIFHVGYKEAEPDETITWENVLKNTILIDEEHVLKVVRCLIHYMETVPMPQRSALFSEQFLKRCSFKIVDLVQELNHYIF